MKLGRPEQFHDKVTLRLLSMERAIAQYRFSADALRKPFASTLGENTALFLKGFGNEVNLLAATRELFFSSRELLDVYLGRLSTATASTGSQTPKDCIPFLKRLLAGDYDGMNQPIFAFLKTNATYVFHIRKVRNEIKTNPGSAEFNFNTNHFELRMMLPIKPEEQNIVSHLDINNVQEALAKKQYAATFNLDILFPEMREFWASFQSLFGQSYTI